MSLDARPPSDYASLEPGASNETLRRSNRTHSVRCLMRTSRFCVSPILTQAVAFMLESLQWWHWVVGGIALVLAELLVPTFFILWFGLGAILVGILYWLFPSMDLTAQVLIWTAASSGMVVLWFQLFKPNLHKSRVGMSDDATLIGEVGLMVREVDQFQRGEVRFQKPLLGSERWGCIADGPIAAGERVKVVSVEGTLLKVKKQH